MKIEPKRAKQFQIGKEKKKRNKYAAYEFWIRFTVRYKHRLEPFVLLAWLSFELSYKM